MLGLRNSVDLTKLGAAVEIAGKRVELLLRAGSDHFDIAVVEIPYHSGDADLFRTPARELPVANALNAAPHDVAASHVAVFIVLRRASGSQPYRLAAAPCTQSLPAPAGAHLSQAAVWRITVPVANIPRSADKAGSKATIHEVARRAKVSITTVSRVINSPSLVDPATAKRVLKAIDELKYYPDVHARSLVSGKSNILGLIVSDITNPFFPELVKGFEDLVIQHGYEVLVSSTNYDPARMALSVRRMLERQVEGVAIMTSEMEDHLIEQLVNRRVPTVFLDVGTPGEGISNIVVDYGHGINEAVQHLADLGHRKIGFVSGPATLSSARIRRSAFVQAINDHGLVQRDEWIGQGDHKVTGGLRAMSELLQLADRPTAVMASNDLTAIGMMSAIRKAGLSVPDDISVVGFDDIWLAELTEPPLTTVEFPRIQVAAQACRALMSDLGKLPAEEQSHEYRIETHLIVRESTAAV